MITSSTADVVVIGGGVIGTAIAYYLSRKKIHVHLLERAHLGSGTSGACGATVALQTKSIGTKLDLAKESVQLLEEFNAESSIDFEYRRVGSLVVALTEEEYRLLSEKGKALNNSGVPAELLNGDDARAHVPGLSRSVIGASYCSIDGSINPFLLVTAYVKAARELGVEISLYSEVLDIEFSHRSVSAVVTPNLRIATPTVVNATGIGAAEISRKVGQKLPIVPRKGEILVTEATRPLLNGELITAGYLGSKVAPEASMDDWFSGNVIDQKLLVGVVASQMKRGNILIGGTREYAGLDRNNTIRAIQELARKATEILPPLADLQLIRTFTGFRPSTPDGLPIIDRCPDLPGFINAAGHEGDGIGLSAVTGKLVSEIVTGEVDLNKLLPLGVARFLGKNNQHD